MQTFQINVLIQFLVSSTRLEHHLFIIRRIICTCSFLWYFFMHLFKQSSRWTVRLLTQMHEKHNIKTTCTRISDLPDDEHMMFETYRRHQELN